MKIKIIAGSIVFIISLALVPHLWGNEDAGGMQSNPLLPVAFVPEPLYRFDPVLDETIVEHTFIIYNTGGALLLINDIKTTCGCTTASYTKEIPAGSEGKIAIKGNTGGYGGNIFKKDIIVSTNDPKNPSIRLQITGQVEIFAHIDPKRVRLNGAAGTRIQTIVTIKQEEKYPFKIVQLSAKEGKNIRFTLKEEGEGYKLTVYNLMEIKGNYLDEIILKTDSAVKPEIKIRVYGSLT